MVEKGVPDLICTQIFKIREAAVALLRKPRESELTGMEMQYSEQWVHERLYTIFVQFYFGLTRF